MSNQFPSTRFLGSKVKLLDWISKNIENLEFDTVLDAFGGTSSFSYLMKRIGKKVYYNDLLKFNQTVAKALIENSDKKVGLQLALDVMKKKKGRRYDTVIQDNFGGVYYKKHENIWLDIVVQNISQIKDKYQRAILFSALYQACLIKRPFNLFHRKNLKIRTTDVKRNFGNKTTWETSFRKHFLKFINEHNKAVFDNKRRNIVIGGYDALNIPLNRYDLVYLDPPYLSKKSRINYLDCYHFLEGMSNYNSWKGRINNETGNKRMVSPKELNQWIDRNQVKELFRKMITKYKNSIIVLSYRNDGIPSIKEINKMFMEIKGKKPIVKTIDYKYALSNGSTKEVLFISK